MGNKPDLTDHGAVKRITYKWRKTTLSQYVTSGVYLTREEAIEAAKKHGRFPHLKYTIDARKLRVIMRHLDLAKATESNQPIKIVRPPAQRATEILRFIFPKKAFDTVFSQIILDMREEYFEALAEGVIWRARLRHLQLWWLLGAASVQWAAASSLRKVYEFWKANP